MRIDRLVLGRGWTVAVAESLTGGLLSSQLARMHDAGEWFLGGVVAYTRSTKQRLLGIGEAPVVSEAAVRAMAENVAHRLGADLTVAVTGVGGPGAEDGIPAGTVWIATRHPSGRIFAALRRFEGGPREVCDQTCVVALAHLLDTAKLPNPPIS